jgi:hypothetical protein
MSLRNRIIWLVVFSIAMGFLEAAVVVYLRELYYPDGFAFPLVVLDPHVGLVEIGREAATIVMLVSLAMLAGQNFRQRLAFFLISFAVWDLFYYVFLKLTLDWPSSLLTWDILFLIPAPWVGPVLSPIVICFTMIGLAVMILRMERDRNLFRLNRTQWLLLLSGSLVVVVTWMWDYLVLSGSLWASPKKALGVLAHYTPTHFHWWAFALGEALILFGIMAPYFRFKASRGMLPW